MKPLTIEELKALEMGDWVWVVDIIYNKGMYCRKGKTRKENTSIDGVVYNSMDKAFCVVDYGKTWLAYKNKEQAECKREN